MPRHRTTSRIGQRPAPPPRDVPAAARVAGAERLATDPSAAPALDGPRIQAVLHGASSLAHPADEIEAGRWVTSYRSRAIVGDALAAGVAWLVAGWIGRSGTLDATTLLAAAVSMVTYVVVVGLLGGYERRRFGASAEEYRPLVLACLGTIAAVSVGAHLIDFHIKPAALLVWVIMLPALALASRFVLRSWLWRLRGQGQLTMRTVVIGRADSVRVLVASMESEPHQGLIPVAVCVPDDADAADLAYFRERGLPALGEPDDVLLTLEDCRAEVVALAADPDLSGMQLRRLSWELGERGVELIVAPGLLDVSGPRMTVRPSTAISLLHVQAPMPSRKTRFFKAVLDRTASIVGLILLSPLLIAVAIAIKVTSPGPVFFMQERIGLHAKPFKIFKFRTMRVGADKEIDALRHLNEGNAVQFKMKRDPRITAIGTFLRQYSIDELPQLINVANGTMSPRRPRASGPQRSREDHRHESEQPSPRRPPPRRRSPRANRRLSRPAHPL